MVHSSATACSDLNGDGGVNVADFLIFVNDFGKTVSCDHVSKVQLVIQNQFNDAVWDTSRNAEGVLTITITKKPPPPPVTPPPSTVTGSIASDRAALLYFFQATFGQYWKNKDNWATNLPLERWHGVKVNAEGRLALSNNKLSGAIPAELGQLSSLEYLRLSNNKLSGAIPQSFENLHRLERFSFDQSKICVPREGNVKFWIQTIVSHFVYCE